MKLKKYTRFISFFIIFSILMSSVASAQYMNTKIPEQITVKVSNDRIAEVKYENYILGANKLKAEGRNEVVYCLEIDQSYPSGEVFNRDYKLNEEVDGIITNGYPNVSYKELNLANEDEAYFATQIAIWSYLENYDINIMKCDNTNILDAIKTIYSKGIKNNRVIKYGNVEYISPNESIQRVVMVFENVIPPQEG